MAISKMQRLTLAAGKRDAERLARELIWLSSVEITEMPEEVKTSFENVEIQKDDTSAYFEKKISQIECVLQMIGPYRKGIPKYPAGEVLGRTEFENLISEKHEAYDAINRLIFINDAVNIYTGELAANENTLLSLEPWKTLDFPQSDLNFRHVSTVFGSFPLETDALSLFEDDNSPDVYIQEISRTALHKYVFVSFLKEDENAVASILSSNSFTRTVFPSSDSAVCRQVSELKERQTALNGKISEMKSEIVSLAKYAPDIERIYDYCVFELSKSKTQDKLFPTGTAVLLIGWVPERRISLVKRTLDDFDCYYEFTPPESDDDVPVELRNGPLSSPFEQIIGLYSYPKYGSYDPTKIMGFFYFIIFGLMIQDIGYGLLMTVGCFLLIKIKHIKGATKQMMKMFGICGISSAIAGALFGGFFGDLIPSFATNMLGHETGPNIALWFSPLNEPEKLMWLLYLSVGVGAVHVLAGMAINAYIQIRDGAFMDALTNEIAWFLIFIGGGAYLAFSFTPFLYVGALGLFILLFFKAYKEKNPILRLGKGILALYDLINYASDVLSYSRIMALGLSGSVIAMVMNLLATIGGPKIFGIILLILLVPLGTAINMAISILGAFVHTARLQYIEFFGKFYQSDGKSFTPEKIETKYTNIYTED